MALKVLPMAVALCFCPAVRADVINSTVSGLPMGGTVAAGAVAGQVTASKMTLTQSTARAVVDWNSFNIQAGKEVQFVQPSASAAVLNRVSASANMSQIAGTMTANGMVVLLNPNGVLFSSGATVNVGSLIVTTGSVNQTSFMAEGPIAITGATTGSVVNEGSITAANAGLVALVAPSVVNKGAIIATGGRIALSGADRATVSLNGGLYEFAVDSGALGTNASITNATGATLAGATLLMSTGDAANLVSGVINLQGVQQASSAIVVDGNTVVLKSDLNAPNISGNSNTVQVHDTASIQDAVKIAKTGTAGAGATVELQAGTFSEQVTLNKANLTLTGAGEAATTIDARSVTSGYGMSVTANDVTLRDFTFYGPSTYYASAYGIKVAPGGAADARLRNFTIRNVTSRGAGKAELDLNGVDGALIDNVTLNGAPVGNDAGTTQGAGLQLTDSANVTVRDTTTLNNAWGGVALYQANRSYNQRMNNVTIEGNNHFNEVNPVYLQDESALYDFGTLSIAGFDYAVRNAASADSGQYTWLQATKQKAYDYAVNLTGASSSYIQGWNGAAATQNFEVGVGNLSAGGNQAMSIATAINQSASGASIHVDAGTYAEQLALNKAGLTLTGQAGAKLVVPDAADVNGIAISANNVAVQGMEIAGPINSPYYDYYATTKPNISRGIAVGDGVTGFTIQNNNIHDVRNGILIHGRNSTGIVSNNRIENTKSGISVQYTDASGLTLSGNSEGTIGNEWGLNLHLNGHLDGSGTILSNSTPIAAAPTSSWQQSLLNLSTANNGWAVQDQGYTSSNRTRVTVATTGAASSQGSRLTPINTIQGGVNAVVAGGKVNVNAGTYAESVSITKALALDGAGAGQSIIDPVSGNAVTVSGNIGANATVLIDGFTFRDAPTAGVSVESDAVLGQLTVQNSVFRGNGAFGFTANGSATAGIPGLANVSLLNSTFEGNGAPSASATSLGQGDIHFNYYNGNATLKDLTITGATEHTGIHFRGYHNATSGAVYDAGTWVFDNVTLAGSFLRPSGSAGTWNPGGPGDAIHLFEYGSVANVSFNNVRVNPTAGHGLFLEGLSSTLNIGNTTFGVPDSTVTGTGTNPTRSMNIVSGSNSQNNVKTNVDATLATFTGATSGFDIEDRVGHALDATGLGLVTWNAGNLYVTPTSGSVQRGIDAASVGNTVNVAAGTYGGFRVNVAGLTVLGDRGNLTAAGPGLNAPFINTCYQGIVCSGVLIDAENVTLSGFDISNASGPYGVQIGEINGARANGATLSYNRIHGVNGVNSGDGIRAVEVEPANNVTIKYNLIEDISPTNAAAASSGKSVAGIFVRSAGGAFSNIAIEDNVIRNIDLLHATDINGAKGIWVGGSAGSASVAGLTIRRNQISDLKSNLGAEGILVNHGKNSSGTTSGLLISGNSISDVAGGASSHAIELSGPTPNALVTQNDINLASSTAADTTGVYFDSNANANASAATVAVSGNRLTGTGYGVTVVGGATVNASGNWWGTTSESGVLAKTSGSVDISPFLMSGTDTDLGSAGFQGNTSNLAVSALGAQTGSTGRIQEGINLGSAGGTLNVNAGNYGESVSLGSLRNLNFIGATLQGLTLNAGAAGSGIGGQVTVNGAGGITFNAAVNLLADTTLATTGSNIALNGDIQNAGSTAYALTLTAGSGGTRGNVQMSTGGTQSNALGQLEVKANRFSLADTLRVKAYKIDALGDVALSNHTLRAMAAGVANTLTSGGNVSGSTTSAGAIVLNSAGNVSANVIADGQATVTGRNISGTIGGSAVTATAQQTLDAAVTASVSAILAGDSIQGSVSAPTLTANAGSTVKLALAVGTADVRAGVRADITGRADRIGLDAKAGRLNGSFPNVENKGNGTIFNNDVPHRSDVAPVPPPFIPPVIVLSPPVPVPVLAPTPAPAPVTVSESVNLDALPPTASGGGGGSMAGPSTPAGGGNSNASGATSGGGNGSTSSGSASGGGTGSSSSGTTSGGASGASSSGATTAEGGSSSSSGSSSSGSSGSSSGSTSSGGGSGSGRVRIVALSGTPVVPVSRSAPGKAGAAIDKGQAVEIDLSPGQ